MRRKLNKMKIKIRKEKNRKENSNFLKSIIIKKLKLMKFMREIN